MTPQEAANNLQHLLRFCSHPKTVGALLLAVAALEREAKAEPVAWRYRHSSIGGWHYLTNYPDHAWGLNAQPLYASPPAPEAKQ